MPDSSHLPEPDASEDPVDPLTPAQRHLIDTLFRTSYTQLCTYATYTGAASWEDAEDIVQQTFLSLVAGHHCLSSPEGSSAVLKYIYTTIDGRIKNAWRDDTLDQQHREHDSDAVQAVVGPIPAPTPDIVVLAAELEAVLVRAIRALPRQPRRILLLKRQGYTYTQIAAMLHVSQSTVNGHMVRALERLRQALRDWRDGKAPDDTVPKDTPETKQDEETDDEIDEETDEEDPR